MKPNRWKARYKRFISHTKCQCSPFSFEAVVRPFQRYVTFRIKRWNIMDFYIDYKSVADDENIMIGV